MNTPYSLTSWVLRVANSLLSVAEFFAVKPIFGFAVESLEVFLADFQANGNRSVDKYVGTALPHEALPPGVLATVMQYCYTC